MIPTLPSSAPRVFRILLVEDTPGDRSPVAAPSDDAALIELAHDPRQEELVRYLEATSVMTARLDSHEGTETAITFLHTAGSGRLHDVEDRVMMRDLARSASLAIENARLYNEVRRAVGLREELVAIASHELRTPLTTSTLQIDPRGLVAEAPEPLRERLITKHGRLQKQAARLEQLVSDLLDVAKSSSDHLELNLQRLDLGQLVRQATERLAEVAVSAGCAVHVHAAAPVVGRWDPRRLEQLVTNLLSNAFKYGKGKAVEIGCSASEGMATISVRDHGIGIAPADAKRVFERFERAVSARQFSGPGLGLYIARTIVMAHGGSIAVTSELGQGAAS